MQRAVFALIVAAASGFWTPLPAAESRSGTAVAANALDLKGERTLLKTAADKPFAAYIVGPKEATRGALVIPAGIGLIESAHRAADRLAELGYRAVAIDIGHGHTIADPTQARAHRQSLDQNDANAKYRAALEALRDPGRQLAVIGWCFGGTQALEAALAAPDLVAAVVIYGVVPTVDVRRLTHLKSPVLIVAAEGESEERTRAFESALQRVGAIAEVKKEPNVGCGARGESMPPVSQAARDFIGRYLK